MPRKPRNRLAQDITRIQKNVIDRRLDTLERQMKALLDGADRAVAVRPIKDKKR